MSIKQKQHNNISKKIFFSFILLLFCFACSSDKAVKKTQPSMEAFKEANNQIKRKDYEAARELLEKIKVEDTSQKYATLAQIRIGDTYFEEGEYEEAAVEYEFFLDLHPYHKYASYVQYQLAMSFFKRIRTADISYSLAKRALNEFEKLQKRYPRNPYMDVTDRKIKKCKSIFAEYELIVGKFYFKKGSYKSAVQRFNNLLQNYPDSKKESEVLYYLGRSYEGLGERDKAINILTTLVEKFPNTKLSKEAKELIASLTQ